MSEPTLADLDRCVHGRHLIDSCFGCPGGQSAGNPYLFNGRRIGTDYGGGEIRCDQVVRERPDDGLDIATTLAVEDDGSVRLILARDVPPEWEGSWDGREVGMGRIWLGMLAFTRFADGRSFEQWLEQVQVWWVEEKRKRPWL